MKSILSDKARSGQIKILDKLQFEEIKTKAFAGLLTRLELDGRKCVVLDEGMNRNAVLSSRNIDKVRYCRASLVSGYDIINADYVVMTKAGLEKVEEVFS